MTGEHVRMVILGAIFGAVVFAMVAAYVRDIRAGKRLRAANKKAHEDAMEACRRDREERVERRLDVVEKKLVALDPSKDAGTEPIGLRVSRLETAIHNLRMGRTT